MRSLTSAGDQPPEGASPLPERDSGPSEPPQDDFSQSPRQDETRLEERTTSRCDDASASHSAPEKPLNDEEFKALRELTIALQKTGSGDNGTWHTFEALITKQNLTADDLREARRRTFKRLDLLDGDAAAYVYRTLESIATERNVDGSYLHDECARSTATR